MTGVLTPSLQPLDEKVLAALSVHVGLRAIRVTQLVHGSPRYECDRCGHGRRIRREPTKWERKAARLCFAPVADGQSCDGIRYPVLLTTAEQRLEVWQILRGLECVGRARQAGGWWRRC